MNSVIFRTFLIFLSIFNYSAILGQPANDNLANATEVTSVPYSNTISANLLRLASDEVNELVCNYQGSWWYKFQPTITGNYLIIADVPTATDANTGQVSIGVYTGSAHPLTQVSCGIVSGANAGAIDVELTSGTDYFIRIAPFDPTQINDVTIVVDFESYEWTGATSDDWDVASNWSTGSVPSVNSNALIFDISQNIPKIKANVNAVAESVSLFDNGALEISQEGSLTISGARADGLSMESTGSVSVNGIVTINNVESSSSGVNVLSGSLLVGQSGQINVNAGDGLGLRVGTSTPVQVNGTISVTNAINVNGVVLSGSGATINITSTGLLKVEGSTSSGNNGIEFFGSGSALNVDGVVEIKNIRLNGIEQGVSSTVTINSGGKVTVDNAQGVGVNLSNANAKLIVSGELSVMNGAGTAGIQSISGDLTVNQGGLINITGITGTALNNILGSNSGTINLSSHLQGLVTGATNFENTTTGSINISSSLVFGMAIANGTFFNNAGQVAIDNPLAPAISSNLTGVFRNRSSGTLVVDGIINAANSVYESASTLKPGKPASTGTLIFTGNEDISNTNLNIQIEGASSGTGYDVIIADSDLNITGTSLNLTGSYEPQVGETFTIIDKAGSSLITGTFTGLAEGATVSSNNVNYTISYVGGTGNDVVLTPIFHQWLGTQSDDWDNALNWSTGAVPTGTSTVIIDDISQNKPVIKNGVNANADFVTLSSSGALEIQDGGSLTIDSQRKDGILMTGASPILEIAGTLRIQNQTQNGINQLEGSITVAQNGSLQIRDVTGVALHNFVGTNNGEIVVSNVGNGIILGGTSNNNATGSISITSSADHGMDVMNGLLFNNGSVKINGCTNETITSPGEDNFINTSTGVLTVEGTIDAPTVSFESIGNTLAPGSSPGCVTFNGTEDFEGTTLNIEIEGTIACAEYDQIIVNGDVTLNNTALNLSGAFSPQLGNTFTIIDNKGTNPIQGAFSAYPEGTQFTSGQFTFSISYVGGDGNDVVLTTVDISTWTGVINDDWNTAGNWSANKVPSATTDVFITDGSQNIPRVKSGVEAVAKSILIFNNGILVVKENGQLTVESDAPIGINMPGELIVEGEVMVKGQEVFGVNVFSGIGQLTMNSTGKLMISDINGTAIYGYSGNNNGSIAISNVGEGIFTTGSVTNTVSGTISISGSSDDGIEIDSGVFNNNGSVTINNCVDKAIFSNNIDVFLNNATGQVTIDGTMDASAIDFQSDGNTFAPGSSPGCAQFDGTEDFTNTTINIEIDGATACTGYDQIAVNGDVTLTGATLNLFGSHIPMTGESFLILDNQGSNAITGTFVGLAEGAQFSSGGFGLTISYVGGDGNDVVLTPLSFEWTGAVSDDWDNAGNWSSNLVPLQNSLAIIKEVSLNTPKIKSGITARIASLRITDSGALEILENGALTILNNIETGVNMGSSGSLKVNGTLNIGGASSLDPAILVTSGSLEVGSTGQINIDAFDGPGLVIATATPVQVDGTISIKEVMSQDGLLLGATNATMNISSTGRLQIEGTGTPGPNGIFMGGTNSALTIDGTVELKNLPGEGITQSLASTVTINASGKVTMDSVMTTGVNLLDPNSKLSVKGELAITHGGTVAGILSTDGLLEVNSGGLLTIDSIAGTGLSNILGSNSGTITMSAIGNGMITGTANFENSATGKITITNSADDGITVGLGQDFDNKGEVSISNATNFAISADQNGVFKNQSTGTLTVDGQVSASNIDLESSSALSPGTSPGCVTFDGTEDFSNTTINIEIEGTTACTQYDQVVVQGDINITGASLNITGSYAPKVSDRFIIMDNQGSNAITGTFNGLAEGTAFNTNGMRFRITYQGGDGNDVVLTPVLFEWIGAVSSDWNTAGNWSTNAVPLANATVSIRDNSQNPCVIGSGINAVAGILEISGTGELSITQNGSLTVASTGDTGIDLSGNGQLNIDGVVTISNHRLTGLYYQAGSFTLSSTGRLTIDATKDGILFEDGLVFNIDGTIDIKNIADRGIVLDKASTVNVNAGGKLIHENHDTWGIILDHPGAILNVFGEIEIKDGEGSGIGGFNGQVMVNQIGNIAIGNMEGHGIFVITGTNNGNINITNTGEGILTKNGATFENGTTGTINISNTVDDGIQVAPNSALNNKGSIIINNAGDNLIEVSQSGIFNNRPTGTLTLDGTVQSLNVVLEGGSTLNPGTSPGCVVFNGSKDFSSTNINIEIDGTSACTQFDQIAVNGDVTLTGAILNITGSYAALPTEVFTILDNQGSNPIVGTFLGLNEGSTFTANSQSFQITYIGGDGNDIVLTSVGYEWTGAVSDDWDMAGNWSTNSVPAANSSVMIKDISQNIPKVKSGVQALAGTISIENSGSLIIEQNGNLSMENTLPNGVNLKDQATLIINDTVTLSGYKNGIIITNNAALLMNATGVLNLNNSNQTAIKGYSGTNNGTINIIGFTDNGIEVANGQTLNNKGAINIDLFNNIPIPISGNFNNQSGGTLLAAGSISATSTVLETGSTLKFFSFSNGLIFDGSEDFSNTTINLDFTGRAGRRRTFITVNGDVNLTNTTLSLTGNETPSLNDQSLLIDNQGTNPVIGTFSGLAEGALINFDGAILRISYQAGDGNDVQLTSLNFEWTGTQSDDWNEPLNWSTGVVPGNKSTVIIKDVSLNTPKVKSGIQAMANSISIENLAALIVEQNGSLMLENSRGTGIDLRNQAKLTINGALNIKNQSTGINLDVTATLEIGATGQVNMSDISSVAIRDYKGTNNGTITVSSGRSGIEIAPGQTLNNQGVITINTPTGTALPQTTGTFRNQSTGTLAVTGTVDAATTILESGSTLNPGASIGCVTFNDSEDFSNTIINVEVNGTTPCISYDQISVNGDVTLSNATLNLSVNLINANLSDSLVILDNQGNNAITGTFSGISEGATLTANGLALQISYVGGDGNDVVLKISPQEWIGSQSDDWNTAGNWSTGTVPTANSYVIIKDISQNIPKIKSGIQAVAGAIEVGQVATLIVQDNGNLNLNGGFQFGISVPNQGQLIIEGTVTIQNKSDGLNIGPLGHLMVATTGQLTIRDIVEIAARGLNGTNNGTINISNVSNGIIVFIGQRFDNFGNFSIDSSPGLAIFSESQFKNQTSGTLTLNGGIVPASPIFENGGTFNPGGPIGKVSIFSSENFSNTTINIEVDGTTPITQHDVIAITGDLTLGGNLNVTFNYNSTVGDRIVFMTYTGSRVGEFATYNSGQDPNNLYYLDYSVAGEVALVVTSAINLDLKVFLQGPYDSNTGLMKTDLKDMPDFPKTKDGYTIGNGVLSQTGNQALVDWVTIEIRIASNRNLVEYTRPALLLANGTIVDMDGSSKVLTPNLPGITNYLAIKHRNHLGVMTRSAIQTN